MKANARNYSVLQRLGALCLAVLMVFTILPARTVAAENEGGILGAVTKVADPDTIRRHDEVYGNNTENAGKVTVGKSVSEDPVTISYAGKSETFAPQGDNFIVTASQTAQVMGLASESAAPVDVVFVLDTSSSMSDEVGAMVTAANNAIKTLLQANPNNRVGVVAFSGTQGGGTSDGNAANMLSPLNHYDGEGETAHLTLTNGYIYGRGYQGSTRLNRDGTSQGTNIHAGVIAGARLLLNATGTTVNGVTRIPFLVVMSDGEPSYAVNDTNWYNPSSLKNQLGYLNQAAGIGFLPALSAAYYKEKITEHYFGDNANANNRCFIYTMGLGLDSLTSNTGKNLAKITVDPSGTPTTNTFYQTFEDYWKSYQSGNEFKVRTDKDDAKKTYTVTKASITATKDYVSTYKYNDAYFSASQASDLNGAFDDIVTTIQKQALSSPTKVNPTLGADFSGYVTYTDPLGEYMEVKDVFGVIADGNFYQGKSFAQYAKAWSNAEFKQEITEVVKKRMSLSNSPITDAQIEAFVRAALASDNQLYYNSDSDYDNSIVWWGKSYIAEGEEDVQIQYRGFADNDTVEYITDAKTEKPSDADYVCRSYYYYGEAGGTAQNPNHEYLSFVIRVQRSLTAPYQQTVVVSTPASLLSVEEVFITEEADGGYTATVTEAEPARVIYEVGLRSDINAFTVDEIVGKDTAKVNSTETYAQETDHSGALANYDAESGTYTFYTNDWDRKKDGSQHHRAQTHVTFDAAADNSFYAYTEDTQILVKNGNSYAPYTDGSYPAGDYYYARTYYDWSADSTPTNGTYDAVQRTAYIPIYIPAGSSRVVQSGRNWVIKAGTYKASSLSTMADVPKSPNKTDTALIVSHPHRTEDALNSHYTVLLGNNGKLTLKAEKTKTVDVEKPARDSYDEDVKENTVKIEKADGQVVMVGDELTYTIRVLNPKTTVAKATVIDTIPRGTEYVENSADPAAELKDGVLTWKNIAVPAATTKTDANGVITKVMGETTVSFKVKVTEAALSGDLDVVTINNTATITLDNGYSYTTNTTENPPEGKKVVDTDGNAIEGSVQVPQVLVYRIRWQNDAVNEKGEPIAATVTITDSIPTGTTYHEEYTQPKATRSGDVLTWTINAAPGASGVVSFRVNVNAAALKDDSEGVRYVENNAIINVNNNPRITNTPKVELKTGDLVISKTVTNKTDFNTIDWNSKTFKLKLYEVGDDLDGVYNITRKVGAAPETTDTVEFELGKIKPATSEETEGYLTIKDGETITIHGLPAGIVILVTEQETGYTATYTVNTPTATGVTTGTSSTEGRATIVAGETATSVEVSNAYDPADVTFNISGKKTFTSSMPLEAQTFGFTAVRHVFNQQDQFVPATEEVPAKTISGEAIYAENETGEKSITFAPITISKAGTYYYVISEIDGGVPGISYDGTKYLLTINVVDNGSGTLIVEDSLTKFNETSEDYTEAVTNKVAAFANTYEPQSTQLSLYGTKTLTGRALKDKEFSFTVKEDGKTVATGYNTDTADEDSLFNNVVFSPITYAAADMKNATETDSNNHPYKVFTYTVTEDKGSAYGTTYDTNSYTVEVTVKDIDGHLKAWVSKVGTTEIAEDAAYTLSFANTFKPDDVPVNLTGTKTLLDHNGAKLELANQQFAFKVEVETTSGKWEPFTTGNNTATNADKVYDIHFSTVYFDLEDLGSQPSKDYRFRITEVKPEGPSLDINMDYDASVYYATVTLSQNADGSLKVSTPVYTKQTTIGEETAATAAFVNTKYPSTTSVTPQATKQTFKGESQSAEGVPNTNFSFEVIDEFGKRVSEGVGSANGTVQFTPINYTNSDVGTHTYTIRETNRSTMPVNGITYDNAEYTMTVTVALQENGKLTASPSYQGGSAPTFTNKYDAAGALNVTAKKALVDENNATVAFGEKTFGFELKQIVSPTDKTVVQGNASLIEGISDTDGNIKFGSVYFDEHSVDSGDIATNYYLITEVDPGSAGYLGVTYDDTEYIIAVELRNDGAGNISTTIKEIYKDGDLMQENEANIVDPDKIVFTNVYEPVTGTSAEFVATKVLPERDLREGEFRFELYYVDDQNVEHFADSAYNMDTDNDGEFDDVYFYREYAATTNPDTYNYVIKEVKGRLGGVTYATNVGKASVTIRDNGKGSLTSDPTVYPEGAITFTNHYAPKGTTLDLTGIKDLRNRDAVEGEFAFDVLRNGQSVATGFNTDLDNDGKYNEIYFTAINFAPADMWDAIKHEYVTSKPFEFEIVEVPGNAERVQYSQEKYKLVVTVTDPQQNGQLSASVTKWYKWDADENTYTEIQQTNALKFTNVYTPQPASVQLKANKSLSGRAMTAGEFTFLVREGIDNPNGTIKATGGNSAAAAGVSAPINFSNIGYNLADITVGGLVQNSKVFNYTIYEAHTGQGGVTFSTNKYARVTVKYDQTSGTLSVDSVEYFNKAEGGTLTIKQDSGSITFANTYTAAPVTVNIPVDKTLVNKKMVEEEFTFTLKGGNSQLGVTVNETAKNDENGSAAFSLELKKPGTYEFTVSESVTKPAKADGTYSMDHDVKVTVVVEDDEKGKLHATVTYTEDKTGISMDGVEFINFYTAPALPADLNAKINAKKQMKSLVDYSMEGFQFQVTDTTGNVVTYVDPADDTKTVKMIGESDKEGNITFPEFRFERAGEYHYWISEMPTEKPGVQIDETRWEVHILVRYNDGSGTAEIKDYAGNTVEAGKLYIGANDIQLYKINRAVDDTVATPVFVNTYDPAGLTLHLTAKKELIGRELRDREFAFYLMDDGVIAAEGFNDAEGNIRFTVNYDAADVGPHAYTIVELKGSVPGVAYDTKEYGAVSVTIADDQTTGKLVASVGQTVLADDDTVDTGVTLSNTYVADGSIAVVRANKELTGKTLKSGEYSFQLVNTKNTEEVYTATNAADGTITFQIPCEKAGETTYELREVKGTDANTTYDTSVYKVTITVTDDGMGNLPVVVTYEDGKIPTFRNTYTPNAVPVKLIGEKVLNGRDMTAGEFKFEVRDSSGGLVAMGTNDAKGALIFNEIKFSVVGTYTLTVTEVKGTAADVTYDTAAFQVNVEVTNEDGTLVAEVTYPESGVKFVNTYEKSEEPTKPTEKPSNPQVPDTGDHSNVTLYMVLAVVSMGACLVLILILKKKKQA